METLKDDRPVSEGRLNMQFFETLAMIGDTLEKAASIQTGADSSAGDSIAKILGAICTRGHSEVNGLDARPLGEVDAGDWRRRK